MASGPGISSSQLPLDYSLLDLLNVARRHIAWLLWPALIAALVSFLVVQFVASPRYESHASILPQQISEVTAKQPVLERGAFLRGFSFRDVTTRNSTNMELMVSDRVRRGVVESLDLVEFFHTASKRLASSEEATQAAMVALAHATRFELSLQLQVLTVRVTTRDPQMSARIAAEYLAQTNAANLDRIHTYAEQRVGFFTQRIAEVKQQVAVLSAQIGTQVQQSRSAAPEREREIAYSFLAPLQQKLLELHLQQDRLASDQAAGSAERLALAAEIHVFQRFLANIDSLAEVRQGLLPTPRHSQLAALERAELERELDLLQGFEASMLESREAARLEAILDVETLTILDRPVVAAEPTWPRKRLVVLLSATLALIGGGVSAFFIDALGRIGAGSTRAGLRRLLGET